MAMLAAWAGSGCELVISAPGTTQGVGGGGGSTSTTTSTSSTGSAGGCVIAADCPGVDTECATRTCAAGACGTSYADAGTPLATQAPGDCQQAVCDGHGGVAVLADDTDVPGDSDPCIIAACANGQPVFAPAPEGSPCGAGGQLACDGAGTCVGCKQDAECGTSTACVALTCDSTTGLCATSYVPNGQGEPGGQATGDCQKLVCDGNGGTVSIADDTDVPDDGNPCTQDACAGGAPSHTPLAAGATCGPGLVCNGAACGASCFIGSAFYAPGTVNSGNACEVCDPSTSTSAWSSRADGTACDDGDACTKTDTCQAGVCVGADPVVCTGGATCADGACTGSCTTGDTIAWTVAVPAPPTPTPPSWCGTMWFHTQSEFSLQGFAAGPSGDVIFAMQWLGPYQSKCYPPPALGIYRHDAAGALAAKMSTSADWHVELSGLAFDPQGNVLFSAGTATGYCPNWSCGTASIERRPPTLSSALFGAVIGASYNDPPFRAKILGGTASGELFAGMVGYAMPYYDTPIYCNGAPITGDSLIHFSATGECLGFVPWTSVKAVGALGGLYTSHEFTGTTDAGCGPLTGSAATNTAVVKLGADGQCIWSRAYPGTVSFALGPAEELLIATSFSGTVDLGGGPLTSTGNRDLAIAVFDAGGQPIWQKSFGAPGASIDVQTFGADTTGGPVVVGSIAGAVDFGCGQVASGKLFAAFDAAGSNRYARVLQVTGAYQAAVDGTGGVYLVSTDTAFDVGTGPLLGGPGVAIARIAP